jgi:uncharacterized membrane protein (UPF0127 family)
MAEVGVSSNGTVLAEHVRLADSVVSRFFGLMGRKKLAPGEALDIRPCGSIHMMWMRFAIDAVFYNKDFRVTKVARNVRPWIGFAGGGKGAHGVIEMAAGTAGDIKPGDLLEFSGPKQGSP